MKCSFVIPAFNAGAWIWPAVKSCLDQTHKDIEVIIVNDGSSDSTKDFLDTYSGFKDPRIKIFHTFNQGRSKARNFGNSQVTGQIICVLDADDACHKNRAAVMVKAFKDGVQFVHGSAIEMTALGEKIKEHIAEPFNKERASEEPYWTHIVHSSVAYTPEFANKFPYDHEMSELGLDDWAQQTAAYTSGVKIDHVPDVVSYYRRLSTAVSNVRDQAKVLEAKKKFIESLKVTA